MLTILTERELFLLIIGAVTYAALFVVTWQNSRRKVLLLQERLNKVHAMQETQDIEANREKIEELERLIAKLGSENSMLRLELEEKKARLNYANIMASIENEKRERAEGDIFGSEVYLRIQQLLNDGKSMSEENWQQLAMLVDSIYTGFTEKLYSLYKLSANDYHVCLLIKVRIQPKDIALLTAHSKESVATTRSRLYQKIFGKKGTTKEWDDFILSL
jgi:regulator of replication initiation timing